MRNGAVPGLATTLFLVTAVAGCGGDGDAADFSEEFSMTAALAEVPAGLPAGRGAVVVAGDLDRVSDAVGVERLERLDSNEPGDDWVAVLSRGAPESEPRRRVELPTGNLLRTIFSSIDFAEPTEDELGWDFLDVDRYVSASSGSEGALDVVLLDPETASALGPVDADGLIHIGSAADGETDIMGRTSLRLLGESWKMAVGEDGLVALSQLTPPVEEWSAGPRRSWADDADLVLVAEHLDRLADLYAAGIAGHAADELGFDGGAMVLYGIGYAGAGDGQRTRLVLLFRTADAATAARAEAEAFASSSLAAEGSGWVFEPDEVSLDGRAVIISGTRVGAGRADR